MNINAGVILLNHSTMTNQNKELFYNLKALYNSDEELFMTIINGQIDDNMPILNHLKIRWRSKWCIEQVKAYYPDYLECQQEIRYNTWLSKYKRNRIPTMSIDSFVEYMLDNKKAAYRYSDYYFKYAHLPKRYSFRSNNPFRYLAKEVRFNIFERIYEIQLFDKIHLIIVAFNRNTSNTFGIYIRQPRKYMRKKRKLFTFLFEFEDLNKTQVMRIVSYFVNTFKT